MHDFSKCSGLIVLQPGQRNIIKTLFSKISLTTKKRFRCCLLTMVKKIGLKKRWLRTLVIYPARKNPENRHKKENVTTSVLNKKGLPRNVCQNILGKRSGGTLERLTRWERSHVPDVPPHIYISLFRK